MDKLVRALPYAVVALQLCLGFVTGEPVHEAAAAVMVFLLVNKD